jgi:DNA-binding GntR family transcriptional regulator
MDTLPSFAIREYGTKQEIVYTAIREAIIAGTLKSGRELTLSQLAESLGVSVMPVREALRRLATEGLVVVVPHIGAQVAPISLRDLEEVFLIRGQLEGLAARMATIRATTEDLAELRRIVDEMDAAGQTAGGHSTPTTRKLNRELHKAILRMANLPILEQMTTQLTDRGTRYELGFMMDKEDWKNRQCYHRAIVEAMERRAGEEAERLMREHLTGAAHTLLEYARGRPEFEL